MILLRAYFKSGSEPYRDWFRPTSLKLRVWPSDLDLLFHMNNGVYLSLMDLGRVEMMLRAKVFTKLSRKGIYPVLASEAIRFKKSLKLFQQFEIQTQILAYDEKGFILGQKFVVTNQVYASAVVRARFLNKKGEKLSPAQLWEHMEVTPPDLPPTPLSEHLTEMESLLQS
jgi:YbgC/YbaW family acyl-CoA thioester hydrolase